MIHIIQRADGSTFHGEVKFVVSHRITQEVYDYLVRQCPGIAVTNDTSSMQAGWQLGVQHVLKLIRDGIVMEAPSP